MSAAFFLLLLTVTLRRSAGNPVVPVTEAQDVYETKEHTNISLSWIYKTSTEDPSGVLLIDLSVKPLRRIYLFDSRLEAEPYTDASYRGRLLCDLQLARKGRVECLLKDLRLSDAGTYQWLVVADGKSQLKKCEVRVTESAHPEPKDQNEDESSNPAGRGRLVLYVGFCLFIVVTVFLVCRCAKLRLVTFKQFSSPQMLPQTV